MKRNNIIMALTLTSLALLFSETECGYIGKLLWRVINDYRRTALKFN